MGIMLRSTEDVCLVAAGVALGIALCKSSSLLGRSQQSTSAKQAAGPPQAEEEVPVGKLGGSSGKVQPCVDEKGFCPGAPNEASVVMVGMRGAGKTTLATAASKALGWDLVDLDHWFVDKHGPIKDLVAAQGWPAFRQLELQALSDVLQAHPTRTVISCGGGIVETEAARAVLIDYFPVVQICKHIDDTEALLEKDQTRANLGEPVRSIWARREPLYHAVSDFDFTIRKGDSDWSAIAGDFGRMMHRITGTGPAPYAGPDSFFLSFTYEDLASAVPVIDELTADVQLLEVRVDLLKSQDPDFVRDQLSLLRRATDCPLLFTVRTSTQGGKFAGSEAEILKLNEVGVRAACEFLDVETNLSAETVSRQVSCSGVCRLVGSFHDMTRMLPADEVASHLRRCTLGGRATLAKVVLGAEKVEDCVTIQRVASSLQLPMPFIAICAGQKGMMSRLLNRCMSPVTHQKLGKVAAPGQMTAKDTMEMRRRLGYAAAL